MVLRIWMLVLCCWAGIANAAETARIVPVSSERPTLVFEMDGVIARVLSASKIAETYKSRFEHFDVSYLRPVQKSGNSKKQSASEAKLYTVLLRPGALKFLYSLRKRFDLVLYAYTQETFVKEIFDQLNFRAQCHSEEFVAFDHFYAHNVFTQISNAAGDGYFTIPEISKTDASKVCFIDAHGTTNRYTTSYPEDHHFVINEQGKIVLNGEIKSYPLNAFRFPLFDLDNYGNELDDSENSATGNKVFDLFLQRLPETGTMRGMAQLEIPEFQPPWYWTYAFSYYGKKLGRILSFSACRECE